MGNIEPQWQCPPELWEKLKPLARELRQNPTPAEKLLWQALRRKQLTDYRFRQQHVINRFIVDFYCAKAKLVIEVDGASHEGNYDYDAARTEILDILGLRVLRFNNEDVLQNLEGVVRVIMGALNITEG
jgi:very-short-patch-repair endonuclease